MSVMPLLDEWWSSRRNRNWSLRDDIFRLDPDFFRDSWLDRYEDVRPSMSTVAKTDRMSNEVQVAHDLKQGFKLILAVPQYQPDELKVKIADGWIIIEGKHEERSDRQNSYVSRQFSRRHKIPEDIDQTKLQSSLSSDGILILEAPSKALMDSNFREIPIYQMKMPAVTRNVPMSAATSSPPPSPAPTESTITIDHQ